MTQKVKSGLYFGLGMTFFYLVKSFIPWITGEEISTREILESVIGAIIAGLVSGLIFGWLSDKYIVGNPFSKSPNFSPESGEDVIFKTPANHFKGGEYVGGTLYLTDKRLVFKSNKVNFQNDELSIQLAQLRAVKRFKMHGFINNGLLVEIVNNNDEKFAVEKPNQWPEVIERTMNGLQQGVWRQSG
jgi:hypothetical protein